MGIAEIVTPILMFVGLVYTGIQIQLLTENAQRKP